MSLLSFAVWPVLVTLLLLLQLFVSKAVSSEDLGFCILHLFCMPTKCYKISVQIAWGVKKNQQNTKIQTNRNHNKKPTKTHQHAVKLAVACLLRVARQALVDLMLNWKLHDLLQIKGQISLLSITSIPCLGNMIMLCVRSCHKMSFASRYSIKRPSNSQLVEQKRISLSVTCPNAFLKSACGFCNFCSYMNRVGLSSIPVFSSYLFSYCPWPVFP